MTQSSNTGGTHTAGENATGTNSEPLLLTQTHNNIAHITLNRPASYNALSEQMLSALQHCIDTIEPDTRVLVIKAKGKAFCAGHDLKQMRDNPSQDYYNELFKTCSRFMNSLLALPQPVIAQVDGIATAAGCQLVANCDLAIASNVSRFAVSGIDVGLFCSTPSVPLSRNVSRKRAFEMLMTGEFIDADKALQWGLVNQVVPPDQLNDAVLELAGKIVSKSAVAVAPLNQAYVLAGETMACNMMADDVSEGIDAFKEKRKPVWKHR